jgi:5-methylcytosine-specific restriction endonuclease McrA
MGRRRERFTLGQLETLFDEVWEGQCELGPRLQLLEHFRGFEAKLADKSVEELTECIKTSNRPRGLRPLVNRFFGWLDDTEEKAKRLHRLFASRPRECEDWRQTGVSSPMLEEVCMLTGNPLLVMKGQGVWHRVDLPGFADLTAGQRKHLQPICVSVNDAHAFFYGCSKARHDIQKKAVLTYDPGFKKQAKLRLRGGFDDDEGDGARVAYDDMKDFSFEALLAALGAARSVTFRHVEPAEVVSELRSVAEYRERISYSVSGSDELSARAIIFRAPKGVKIQCRRVSRLAPLLNAASKRLLARCYDVRYVGEEQPSFVARAVEALKLNRRCYLTKEQREQVLADYSRVCPHCGQDGGLQLDHKVSLADGGSNDPDNFQPLCRDCHSRKTQAERKGGPHVLASELSLRSRELFLGTPKPKQQSGGRWDDVLDANGLPEAKADDAFPVIDVKGCRLNALLQRPPRLRLGGVLTSLAGCRSSRPATSSRKSTNGAISTSSRWRDRKSVV